MAENFAQVAGTHARRERTAETRTGRSRVRRAVAESVVPAAEARGYVAGVFAEKRIFEVFCHRLRKRRKLTLSAASFN